LGGGDGLRLPDAVGTVEVRQDLVGAVGIEEPPQADPDGYRVDGQCGHIAAVVLEDGGIVSAYGQYRLGAAVLIRWKPESGPIEAVPENGPEGR
jgi:hypothetical protein